MPAPFKPVHSIGHFLSACTHHLPAALVVSALVYICHHHLHLLDAVDGYAFLGIGNLAAHYTPQTVATRPMVAVIEIDQQSHEQYYGGRSPLDRCELKRDLEDIYTQDVPPKLLVIDLDLSPVLPSRYLTSGENADADRCTSEITNLITQHLATHTVLITPFDVMDPENKANIVAWQKSLEPLTNVVSFADPTISVRYGMVNGLACTFKTLAGAAFDHFPDKIPGDENCLSEGDKELKINPKHYLSSLRPVSVRQLPSRQPGAPITGTRQCKPLAPFPVVFFGSITGDSDTYLTPLGTMYGVEVHAAAFMSLLQPTKGNEWLAFTLDIVLGLILGLIIDYCWRRYFSLRFSSRAIQRQAAPWLIVAMFIVYSAVVCLFTVLSFFILLIGGIWLSPIPIALGMLIESFFNGAIAIAVKEGYAQRQAMVGRLQAAGPDGYCSQLEREADQRPHHAGNLDERLARFFYLDRQRLRSTGQHGAANLLLVRRLMFFLVLLLAMFWDEFVRVGSWLVGWFAYFWNNFLHFIEAIS
jgi:hypothetical protein